MSDDAGLGEFLDQTTRIVLQARNAAGHWEGELSSSALSTATAVFALSTYEQSAGVAIGLARRDWLRQCVRKGIEWICDHQNGDGGWGDTVISISNISTTALCWAALSLGDSGAEPGELGCTSVPARHKRGGPARLAACGLAGQGTASLRSASSPAKPQAAAFTTARRNGCEPGELSPGICPSPGTPGEGRGGGRLAVQKAEAWLTRAAGSLEPAQLAAAIKARYGKDQTFSVPILTMCALAGRLGSGREAWRFVPQLPFELAACPPKWFQWLQLRVVSYALPALIAMGQVRHIRRPSRNPLARALRNLTRRRTLRLLQQIQPENGGFLEATPLTSFVVMSLVGSGQSQHAVTARGIAFLEQSMRPDGSWAIDTNLSTWLTTLSVNALACNPRFDAILGAQDRSIIRHWLLSQQYRVEHPYTHAAPGAWAWTDLPGGVPDADDTAGALLALWNLGFRDAQTCEAASAAVTWLLDLQNRDGGIPTFCRGWGRLPFDHSGCDLTAHALHAWMTWRDVLADHVQIRIDAAADRACAFLRKQQRPDGSWIPLWFGNQFAPDDENPTYGTARVLIALCAVRPHAPNDAEADPMIVRGIAWLLKAQNNDGGWGGASSTPSSIEETSLAVQALASYCKNAPEIDRRPVRAAVFRGVAWLSDRSEQGGQFDPAPIGFYFAKLWYFERHYPALFCCAALGRSAALLQDAPSQYQTPISTGSQRP